MTPAAGPSRARTASGCSGATSATSPRSRARSTSSTCSTSPTAGSATARSNGYALEACLTSACTGGVQPALYAYDKHGMHNNITARRSDSTFYLAEVGPQYAGKTLVIELCDPGESSGRQPLPDATVVHVSWSRSTPCLQTSVASSRRDRATPRVSDLHQARSCALRTADSGALYNGHWVTIRVAIPPTYTCTVGLDPEVSSGSCWWGISATRSAVGAHPPTRPPGRRIEGNPVHLTQ